MTRTNRIILFSVVAIGIGYFTLKFLCEVGVKCKNCPTISSTMEESKKDGYFVTTYKPLTDQLKLKYHDDTVDFQTAWAEHSWFVNSDNCLFKRKEKLNDFNLTIEFKKYPGDTFNFKLEGWGVGRGMGQSSKSVTIDKLYDTLTFQIVEKNPKKGIGWQEPVDGEQVQFVRVK
jgi:hypothetical protein